MRPSHTFSTDQRRVSRLLGRGFLLTALFFAATIANAQTNLPSNTNLNDVGIRTLEQASKVGTNEAAPRDDRDQPVSPPEPNDAGPGMIPPPPTETTPDAPSPPATEPDQILPTQAQRTPTDTLAKPSGSIAPAKPSSVLPTEFPTSAKPEEKPLAPVASASRPAAPAVTDFSSFKIISDRNIFDPNRSPRRAGSPARRARTVESVTLVGTMSYEKGDFAFFNGTSAEHKKVLKASDTIAGYKLASIGANSVKLSAGGKEVELKIGSQLRREEEGEWALSTQTEAYATTPAASSAGAAKSSDAGAASDGAESDVLKKLMQRREQE